MEKVGIVELRRLGRLEHRSSVLIYGAAALSEVSQEEADRSVAEALDGGINHFDVAADYGDAELRLGPWMAQIRDRIFLATKTGRRDKETAWAEINASLERLQTDRLDLIQLHAVGTGSELDLVTGAGGALEAAVRALDEGLVGAIGITGHGHDAPAVHLEALRRHPFATVLTPLNPKLFSDATYKSHYEALCAEVEIQDVGLMIIKTIARRNWTHEDTANYATWYEPFNDQRRISAAVSWAVARPEITGIATPGDASLLHMVLRGERERINAQEAERTLLSDPAYKSPFDSMPF